MTTQTIQDLNALTLIGFTEKRGNAWHYKAELQGDEPNHYPGAVPVEAVRRRLFGWQAVEGSITATHLSDDGVIVTEDHKRKAIMRSDTGAILGYFSGQPGSPEGYKIHQYEEWLVDYIVRLLDADLHIGSAGLLDAGGRAWVSIEMEDTMDAAEGITFRPFLTGATSLDGSLATTYLTGAQIPVCDNTLSTALKGADTKVKVKHSRYSHSKISDVREALGIMFGTAETFKAQVLELLDEKVDEPTFKRFVGAYVDLKPGATDRSKNMAATKIDALTRLWKFDPRVAPWAGTAYGLLAAVNTYVHHEGTVRAAGAGTANAKRAARNVDNTIRGEWDKVDNATLRLLAEVR